MLPTDSPSYRLVDLILRCGAQFTSKMEGMLNDLSIGTDTSRAFGEFVRSNQEAKTSLGKMEFTVQVESKYLFNHPIAALLSCATLS